MGLQKSFTFENPITGVEDLTAPDGKVVGKVFIVIDGDTKDVYRVPMVEKVAKRNGQLLMGISRIKVSDQADLKEILGGRQ